MTRYFILAISIILNFQEAFAATQMPSQNTRPAAQNDYKNRPDPCELKHKKSPNNASVPKKETPAAKR